MQPNSSKVRGVVLALGIIAMVILLFVRGEAQNLWGVVIIGLIAGAILFFVGARESCASSFPTALHQERPVDRTCHDDLPTQAQRVGT